MTDAFRCAEAARAAGDPLEGSAPPAEQWFLVEHSGPWDRQVIPGSRLDRTAAAALAGWAQEHRGRVLLVRRPGRADRLPDRRRWFRIDSRPGREELRGGLFAHERELAGVVADPGAGQLQDGPLVLVCTHGRHDPCCAVRGRPLAAAVAAATPAETWETSHVGGCRFAAAMVLLPHGFVLGDVPVPDGPGIAARYRAGELDPRWVRGRSSLPPVVQAAQHHARLATGAVGVDALVPVSATPDAAGWTVVLTAPDVTVRLRERRVTTERRLTCAAAGSGWMRVFEPVDVAAASAFPVSPGR